MFSWTRKRYRGWEAEVFPGSYWGDWQIRLKSPDGSDFSVKDTGASMTRRAAVRRAIRNQQDNSNDSSGIRRYKF